MSKDVHLKDKMELKALSNFIRNILYKHKYSNLYMHIAKTYLLMIRKFKGKRKKDKTLVLGNKRSKEHLYYNICQNPARFIGIKEDIFGGFWSYIIIKMNFID